MRADRFWKKTRKKITIQGTDVAGFDKSKVEYFNCHKMGHFARECRAPRNQDRGRREIYKQDSKEEEKAPKALMDIDRVGWDWSYMANEEENHALVADDEALTEFALMAKSSSSSKNKVFDDSLCSKSCKKNTYSLNTKITNLNKALSDSKTNLYHYKLALLQVEARLVEFKTQEISFCEKIRGLEFDVKNKNIKIKRLTNELEKIKKEKDGLDSKLTGFESASKDLDTLLGSQRYDKNKKGLGYSAVPPYAQVYSPLKKDMSWTGLLEFANDTITDYSRPSPSLESNSSDLQNSNSSVSEHKESLESIMSKPMIKFVKAADSPTVIKTNKVETVRKQSVKYAKMYRNTSKSPKTQVGNGLGPQRELILFLLCVKGNYQNIINDKGYWDSGCSRHMTGNISYLSDYEPYDGGYVSFGQGGGKITGKGIIKTGKLKFENVYFVKDLKYNLFSVSQICDNKNSVLFTDSECIVLVRDFKLKDDTNVLLRNPRQHNMYSIDLNNIVPHKDLSCLVAKASADESMLWHMRLSHLNFKTMNKLVRHNLVKGLPSKFFKNDHTCVAFLKRKQHKASCKTKLVNSVSKPLHTLYMGLFGPTSVSSLNHKWYCLVVIDDFSRFTWTFFLKTKDKTSGILRNFITEIENLKDLKVKIIRSLFEAARTMLADAKLPVTFWAKAVNIACYVQNRVLVNKSQNKTPYELFNTRTPAIGFLKPFGCHFMILNTLDHLGKFDAKGDEDYFIGYSMSSKAFRVFNKRTTRVEENMHVDFLENKLIEKGAGPNWLFDIDTLTNSMNYVPVVVAGTSSTNFSSPKDAASQDVSSLRYIALPNWFHEVHLESSTSNSQDACNADAPESSGNSNPTATSTNPPADRMETLTVESAIPTVSSPVLTACLDDSPEPSSTTRLISKRVTSQDETPSLDNISTLSNRFEDILGVTTNKGDINGVEANLGNMEYNISASPTPTFRIHKGHLKSQIIGPVDTPMDVKSAFLYGTIDEKVYVMQPRGFQDPQFPDKVYKVEKTIEFEALMHEKFQMSAMGELNFFLGLQVLQKEDGIFLSQDKYVGDILKKFGYSDVRSANTPMDKENPWEKDRPDIMFAVCACARHQVTPKECHLHAVKRIFRYLKGHPKLGLWYPKDSPFDLVAYSDRDYGGAT
nr:hypothetical protein [Tanacetum cinerariifolium]